MTRNSKHSTPNNKRTTTKSQKLLESDSNGSLQVINHSGLNKSTKIDILLVKVIKQSYTEQYNKPNIIFLNPDTILLTTFNFFGYVLLNYQHKNVICVVYPDQMVDRNYVLIPDFVSNSLQVEDDTVITLSLVKNRIPIASKVVLQCDNSMMKKDDPTFEYITHQLEGVILNNNDILNITFQNNLYTMKVINLIGGKGYDQLSCTIGSNISKCSINQSDITTLMDNLELFASDKSNVSSQKLPNDSTNNNNSNHIDESSYGFIIRKNVTTIKYSLITESCAIMTVNSKENSSNNTLPLHGFETVLDNLQNIIIIPLKYINLIKTSGLMVPYGVLIHGYHGSGKTTIIERLCSDPDIESMWIDLNEIKRDYTDPIQHLYDIFGELKSTKNPTIVIIENIENYYPKDGRELMNEELEELCQILFSQLTKLRKIATKTEQKIPISIIGTCSDISKLYMGLYQNGIFDIEYEIPVPTSDERYKMLEGILSKIDHELDRNQINFLANHSHGYLPKDLVLLVQLSGINCLKRYHNNNNNSSTNEKSIRLNYDDMKNSLNEINPSVIKTFTTTIPKIRWDDIGGMENVKNHLKECILWPMLYPDILTNMGIEPSGGVLLYGPPGCSKTMMARALAGESQMNFISIKGPELLNKYVGETEKTIRDLFRRARMAAPCILFFDEMDAIASQRDTSSSGHSDFNDRILAQFLTEFDGITGSNLNVYVVAATNRPFSIDSALMRPGRFDRLVYVPLPDSISRKCIFELQFRKIPIDKSIDVDYVVELTDGYSGAELVALCKEAAYCALRDDINTKFVSITHFQRALTNIPPRVTHNLLQMYLNFKNHNDRS